MTDERRAQLEAEAKGRRRLLYIRERALLQNHRDGYPTHPKPYKQQSEYAALDAEFGDEVPDEEWETSPWRWHGDG